MSDIVERLRTLHRMYSIGGTTLDEAADTITALRAEVEKVRAILEQARDGEEIYRLARINSALAALTQTKDTTDARV